MFAQGAELAVSDGEIGRCFPSDDFITPEKKQLIIIADCLPRQPFLLLHHKHETQT